MNKINRFYIATCIKMFLAYLTASFFMAAPLVSCAGSSSSSETVSQQDTASVSLQFSGENAMNHVYSQIAMGPRTSKDAKQTKLRDYLCEKLKAYGFSVQIQPLTGETGMGAGVNFYNVIATYPPGSVKPVKIFGAHYDTIPIAPNDPAEAARLTPIDGANDGASGTAVLLELARTVTGRAKDLKYSVKLVFFDGEDFYTGVENMFYGSKYYAKSLDAEEKKNIKYFVLIDMIGDSDLNVYKELNSVYAYPGLAAHVFETAAKLNLNGFHSEIKHQITDDHLPMIAAGIPSTLLIDFDYPYWHRLSDTADKLSADSLAKTGKLLEYLIFE